MSDATAEVQNKLVVIEKGKLAAMAASQRFLTEFPFLRSLAPSSAPKRRCGSCGSGRGSGVVAEETYQAALRTIAGLPENKKHALRRLLNTRRVRIIYNQGGRRVELTF